MRFVVLHHTGFGDPHYDLMLELEPGGPLRTWRSPVWPLANQTPLTPLQNLRREYLTYEGEVSRGRGNVRRVAGGEYELVHHGGLMLIVRLPGEDGPVEWILANAPSGAAAILARPKS